MNEIEAFVLGKNWAFQAAVEDSSDTVAQTAWESAHSTILGDPYFSLITPLWNTPPEFLREVILSCLAQSFRQWELILVDDGSKQTSHFKIADQYAKMDTRIRFFKLEKNHGIGGARNIAFTFCRGRYIGILDHDDYLHPRVLFHFHQLLAKGSFSLLFCNEAKVNHQGKLLSDFFFKPRFDAQTLLRSNYLAHFTVVERSFLERIKDRNSYVFRPGFDGVEDHDYFLRISQLEGFRAGHSPVFGYYWRRSENSTAESLDKKPYVKERLLSLIKSHAPEGSQVLWPTSDAQKFPALRFSDEVNIPPCDLFIWGESNQQNVECALRLKSTKDVHWTKVESEIFNENPLLTAVRNYSADSPNSEGHEGLLLIVHATIKLDENVVRQMTQFLECNPGYRSVGVGVQDSFGNECGDVAIELYPSSLLPAVKLRLIQDSMDFPTDQRLGRLPVPYCLLLRRPRFTDRMELFAWLIHGAIEGKHFYLGNLKALVDMTFRSRVIPIDEPALAPIINYLKSVQLSYDPQDRWIHGSRYNSDWRALPLRYKAADRLNSLVKRWFAPLQTAFKLLADRVS